MYKLLIVDDEPANLRLLERLFSREYYCLTASSGADAIQLLEQHDVAILITDQRMPQMTGIELLKRTSELRPHMVRILLTGYTDVEALVEALNCGLVYMYITKPWKNDELKLKVSRAIEHYENNKKHSALTVANERLNLRLNEMKLGFVAALAQALEAKDEYEHEHAFRVSSYADAIAEKLGLSDEDRSDLSSAALLHNLGHLGTPEKVLTTVPLTSDELQIFRSHPERAARLLSAIPELRNVADIIRFHRENFDATGYPRGLGGEQIPLACRIIRVAEAYDSLTQPRNLSAAINSSEAARFLLDRAGKDFDPAVVKVMVNLHPPTLVEIENDSDLEWKVETRSEIPSDFVDARV
jgi:response regulator RpfG family c-di-GMP phosphodiesterase